MPTSGKNIKKIENKSLGELKPHQFENNHLNFTISEFSPCKFS